jgi:hypothetical protein
VLANSKGENTFKMWEEIRGRELSLIFGLFVLAFIGKAILKRIKLNFKGRLLITTF